MIAKLTGTMDSSGEDWVVIDVGGVGYLIFCSVRTLNALTAAVGMVSVLIETHVREDHIHLYGFHSESEKAWFKLLTTVQGVGAKVGLAILSSIAPDMLAQSIAAGDKAAVTQAPGVGPKLATRIISELKDIMGGIALGEAAMPGTRISDGESGVADADPASQAAADAVSALVNLGYGRTEAFGAVSHAAQKIEGDVTVESLIKDGLSELTPVEVHG